MPRPRYWLYSRDRGFTAVSAQEFLFAAFWARLDVWASGRDTIAVVP